MHQSVYELVHTEDQQELRRNLHWALNPPSAASSSISQDSPQGERSPLLDDRSRSKNNFLSSDILKGKKVGSMRSKVRFHLTEGPNKAKRKRTVNQVDSGHLD